MRASRPAYGSPLSSVAPLALIVGIVLLVDSCANPSVVAPSAGSSAGQIGSPTPGTASDGALVAPFSVSDGLYYFDKPSGITPRVDADTAIKTFNSTGLYSSELQDHQPDVFLAALTSYAKSAKVSPSGHLVPDTTNESVWAIMYTHVPGEAVGAGGGAGSPESSSSDSSADITYEDVIAIIDTDSGTLTTVLTTVPDDAVIADGPTANPAK